MTDRDWWSVVTYSTGAVLGMWMVRKYDYSYTAGAAIAIAARLFACLIANRVLR